MPYIDRDKFLKSMISRFKCVPLIGVPMTINGEECFDGEDLQQVLNQAPTEDVVARAEVEELFKKIQNQTSIGIRHLKELIGETKAKYNLVMLKGRLTELCNTEKFIAELKKKYIGE